MSLDQSFLDRIAAAAEKAGLADVRYAWAPSPIGRLLVASTNEGVCRIAFAEEREDDVLAELARRLSPRIVRSAELERGAAAAIGAYVAGELDHLDMPADLSLVTTPFGRSVLDKLMEVKRGKVTTYGALAARIGNPRAVRATGTALGRNPVPILVPCHRVLPSGGSVGNYGGGPDRKRYLLELEGVPLPSTRRRTTEALDSSKDVG